MRTRLLTAAAAILILAASPLAQSPRFSKTGWTELFNGRDLAGWHLRQPDGPNGWSVKGGVYINTPKSTDIQTDANYYNFLLHVEFNVAPNGNSGVYMRDKYEVQIFDSFGKPPDQGGCGALYKRIAPAVNASKPAGEWQTYDITFIGQRLSVFHNGKKVLDNVDTGPKGTGAASNRDDGPGPLRLQGDHEAVQFRNLRIRPLSREEAEKMLKNM